MGILDVLALQEGSQEAGDTAEFECLLTSWGPIYPASQIGLCRPGDVILEGPPVRLLCASSGFVQKLCLAFEEPLREYTYGDHASSSGFFAHETLEEFAALAV